MPLYHSLLQPYFHFIGGRRCWTGRQATNHLWLPDAPNACASWDDGTCGARHGGIRFFHSCARRLRVVAEERGLREGRQDGRIGQRTLGVVGGRNINLCSLALEHFWHIHFSSLCAT